MLDPSGAPVRGARVIAILIAAGGVRETRTDADGSYSIPYLAPGTYRVEVEAPGFKLWREAAAEVGIDTIVRVDSQLVLGTQAEVVEVHDESTVLQTDRGDLVRSFSRRSVTELPLSTENIYDLAALLPGVTPTASISTTLQNPMNSRSFQVNGQPQSANNNQIDGIDNNEPLIGVTVAVPPAEAVQEVSFSLGSYSAELGRAGGAVVNVTTRAGTNDFHGSLFEFHQDDHLAARNFFNVVGQAKPTSLSNKYGGTLSGPLRRNHAFFEISFQGTAQRQASTQTGSVPVSAWRQGDFSGVAGLTVYDPDTGSASGTGRLPFVGNRIPASRFHPVAVKLLPDLELPNVSGLQANLIENIPSRVKGEQTGARFDQQIGSRTQLFAKYDSALFDVQNDALLGRLLGAGADSHVFTQTAVLNVTHTFSPTLIAENRFGYNRYRTNVAGFNTADLNARYGIGDPTPTSLSASGLADIAIGGMPAIGLSIIYPIVNTDNIFNLSSSWTKIAGRHAWKFGADLRRLRLDRLQATGLSLGPRGLFAFNPGTTALKGGPAIGSFGTLGNSFAAFLLGATDEVGRTYLTVTPTNRQWNLFGYVNDTWQVTPRLTLDIGLRWELYTPVVPRYAGGASNYDPSTNSLLVAGVGGVGLSTGIRTQWKNWAPRFGFAWRGSKDLVVRGGYGISYFEGTNGFTGGTLSTQFPVVGNIQVGTTNDFVVDGSFNAIPAIPTIPIPASGIVQPAPNQALYYVPSDNRFPYVQSFNLTVQRRLAWGFAADAGYVGSLGRRIANDWELNEALPGTGTAGRLLNRLYGRTASTDERSYSGSDNYNSLQINVSRRLAGGIFLMANYTHGKSLQYGATMGFHQTYGPSAFDRADSFKLAHLVELPFGKGKRWLANGWPARFAGGWQLSGILMYASGLAVTVSADATACNCPGNSQVADAVSPVQYPGGLGRGRLWFTPSSFAAPGANRFGTAGIGTVRGPGFTNYDLSLFRRFTWRERWTIEIRGEAFNVTNTPHFGTPDVSVNSATFGQVLSTLNNGGQRQLQAAARIVF